MPRKVARWFAHMDVDGTTVAKTPLAKAVWALLPYLCVQTPGEHPPITLEVQQDSALLSSIAAERGTGQADPPSSINCVAVYDIIATALGILDEQIGDPTWVGGEVNGVYANNNYRYTDDSLCGSHSAEVIKKKTDLVFACCIILGIRLSHRKIMRLLSCGYYSTSVQIRAWPLQRL